MSKRDAEDSTRDSTEMVRINSTLEPGQLEFRHSKMNRRVVIKSDSNHPGVDALVDVVFALTKLNYPSVLTIMKDHGVVWGKKSAE